MFVVRRSFRNCGEMMLPGSIVEPGSIKRFKTRLKDRDIVEVSPHDFDQWNNYFVGKFGVALVDPAAKPTEAPKEDAPEVHDKPAEPAKTPVKVVVAVKK